MHYSDITVSIIASIYLKWRGATPGRHGISLTGIAINQTVISVSLANRSNAPESDAKTPVCTTVEMPHRT